MIDKSLKMAYGSYNMPDEIKDLQKLEEQLASEDLSLEMIGLRLAYTYNRYSITPPDLIPFADTGGDGVHFGVLTDFGQAETLEAAPIVCVTPTNDPPIRLIARNIADFLDLVSSVPHAEFLEEWWGRRDEAGIAAASEAFCRDAPYERKAERERVQARFQNAFGTRKRNVPTYIHEVLTEREQKIALPTLDGLGVTGASGNFQRFEFSSANGGEEREQQRMRSFLANACREEKLAFVRDANYRYILTPDYDADVAELVREVLLAMGLTDEAARMFDLGGDR